MTGLKSILTTIEREKRELAEQLLAAREELARRDSTIKKLIVGSDADAIERDRLEMLVDALVDKARQLRDELQRMQDGVCADVHEEAAKKNEALAAENAKLRAELAALRGDMESLMAEMAQITTDDLERVRDEWREVRRRREEWRNNTTPEAVPYRVENQTPAQVTQGEWKEQVSE